MNKDKIKDLLTQTFVSEAKVPGLDIVNKIKKETDKFNKKDLKDSATKLSNYGKKSNEKVEEPVKFNYNNKEEEYHQEMEIMNGQEMIQYDRTPNDKFKKRAEDAIAGATYMGNNPEWANVVPKQQGFTGPDFGKNLVKAIKSSEKKRSKQTPTSKMFGNDWEVVDDQGHKSYAFENENKGNLLESELGEGYTHFAILKSDNKIVDGWDYSNLYDEDSRSYDNQSIKEYSKMDLTDNYPENKLSDFKIINRKTLEKMGINPSDTNNWYKFNNNENLNENNKMKRLTFKKPFNGIDNALKLIPESYKVDNKTFEITDGNESYRVRWEGSLNEGKGIVLMASNKTMVNEDMQKMFHLMGYKSEQTLGNLKGSERLNEDKKFSDIWSKTKTILTESEEDEETIDEELKGKQEEIDANKDGKISGDDFEILNNKKEVDEDMSKDAERLDTLLNKNSALTNAMSKINTKQELIDTMKMLYTDVLKNNPALASSETSLMQALKDVSKEIKNNTQPQSAPVTETDDMHEEEDRFDEIFKGLDEE
jgi:hypothetical protein